MLGKSSDREWRRGESNPATRDTGPVECGFFGDRTPPSPTEIRGFGQSLPWASLRPFFGFYGGKWRDAPKNYSPPHHDTIVEPFAGSAGYSVRHADRKVILGEIDEVIYGVWHYLLHATADEIRAIPDLEPGQTVADLSIPQEARWLVGFWLNRGASHPRKGPSAWMRAGIRPGSFWGERVRQTIAAQVDRIRHWQVFNCSYENLPFSGAATWFVDPPYQNQGKHYRYGAEDVDFKALGPWCRTRPGQVIVCENAGADWLPFVTLGDVKTTRARARSVEAVWTQERGALDSPPTS